MSFIDKYKPNNIENLFFHKEICKFLEKISNEDDLPHLILCGPEGSGKNTIIQMFLSMIFNENAVKNIKNITYDVNASNNKPLKEKIKQSDYHIVIEPKNTNYDKYMIHDIVKEYAQRKSLNIFKNNRNFKIVVIKNIDNMSYYAQTSLRRTMEQQSEICRFVMTCKTLSKIISPLISRCICIRVPSPSNLDLYTYLLNICVKEGMIEEIDDVHKIVKSADGNIKTALWQLEFLKYKIPNKTNYNEGIDTIVSLILKGDLYDIIMIRKILNNLMITTIDHSVILTKILLKLCSNKKIDDEMKVQIINVASNASYGLLKSRRKIIQFDMFIANAINIVKKKLK